MQDRRPSHFIRALKEFVVRALIDWWHRNTCEHWKANVAMSFVAAIISGYAIRWSVGFWAMFLPHDSWAGELVIGAISMSGRAFALTMAVSALGGVASFMHEVRGDPTNLRIINALGHMFSAQFAGLIMFLLTVEWGMSTPYGLALCGVAGWGGNKTMTVLSDRLLAKAGIDTQSR